VRTSVRIAAALLVALPLFAPRLAHAGESTLFPDLRREDFPERPDSVRLEWTGASPGAASLRAFHWREGDMAFPSLLTAAASKDPRTGERRFEVLRVDDDCLAFAEQNRLSEEEACLAITATNLAPGVERLVFRSRFLNYQVQLILVQSSDGADEWNLLPTGRRGEPRLLRLRTRDQGDGSLLATWDLYQADGGDEIALPLAATVPIDGLRRAELTSFDAGMLASLDFFYDLVHSYIDDWVVRREDQTVDEGIPSPEENDPSQCEVETMCSAEHQSCTPTVGGWLACDFDGGLGGWLACDFDGGLGGWGGGFDPGGGGHDVGPFPPDEPTPDWRTGPMTYPAAAQPSFDGVKLVAGHYRLDFQLTSVLLFTSTVAVTQPAPISTGAKHVVQLFVTRLGGDVPSPGCTEIWATVQTAGTTVPSDDAVSYPKGSPRQRDCSLPPRGFYRLHYELDPFGTWFEGTGEANNSGVASGLWYSGG